MMRGKVACCTITWTFRPSDPLPKGAWPGEMIGDVLREIKEAGYEGVELGAHIEDIGGVEGTRKLLDEAGLKLVRAGTKREAEGGIADLKELGCVCLMMGTPHRKSFPGGKPSEEEYLRVAADLDKKAKFYREEYGMPVGLHNHLWTMAESRHEVDMIMENAPHLDLLLDIAHLKGAGDDPVAAIRDYAGRIVHTHIKDRDERLFIPEPSSPGPWHPGFVELGKGNVGLDLPACLKALEDTGYDGWLSVELDTSDTPFESNKMNRDYLRKLGY